MASTPSDNGKLFRTGTQGRIQVTLLAIIRDQPGGTYAYYSEVRGRSAGALIRQFWERGWVKPDRDFPTHWSITEAGEEVLRTHAHLIA